MRTEAMGREMKWEFGCNNELTDSLRTSSSLVSADHNPWQYLQIIGLSESP